MTNMEYTAVPTVRFEQLCKAENDANMLKAFIADHYEAEKPVFNDEIETLYKLFIGKKDEVICMKEVDNV